MAQEIETIVVELGAAAIVGYMQAVVYSRLFAQLPRKFLLWGYTVIYVCVYGLTVYAELGMGESFPFAHTLCTALLGGGLLLFLKGSGERLGRDAWASAAAAALTGTAEWTLLVMSNAGLGHWLQATKWVNASAIKVITAVFLGLFLLLFYTMWRLFVQRKRPDPSHIYSLLYSSQTFALCVLLYQGLVAQSGRLLVVVLLSALIFAAADAGVYFAMREVRQADSVRRQFESEKRHLENRDVYSRAVADQHESIANIRSDIRVLFERAIQLLEQRRLADFRQLMLNDSEVLQGKAFVFCDNAVVNALLIAKKRTMDASGISFRSAVLLEERTPFDDLDLCCIYSNLLDNAIEASRALVGERGAQIRLDSFESSGYYIIRCLNHCRKRPVILPNGRLQSGKRAADEHGLGMLIIEEIAQKYNGLCRFSSEEDRTEGVLFKVCVYLHLNGADVDKERQHIALNNWQPAVAGADAAREHAATRQGSKEDA